jgi:hypothetical protein
MSECLENRVSLFANAETARVVKLCKRLLNNRIECFSDAAVASDAAVDGDSSRNETANFPFQPWDEPSSSSHRRHR